MNLQGSLVHHKAYGTGKIVSVDGSLISVAFPGGEKKFQYPNCFSEFLRLENTGMQETMLDVIEKENQQKLFEQQKATEKKREIEQKFTSLQTSKKYRSKTSTKENIAFKCNFCDGGKTINGIGYNGVCSDKIIRYNIEHAHHKWCSNNDSPCNMYHQRKIDRAYLDNLTKENEFVCYESKMLKEWAAYAGYELSDEGKKRPKHFNNINVNSVAVLTTRFPNEPENERFVFALFIAKDIYHGDDVNEGYAKASDKYRISLTLEHAKKIKFWNYYQNENKPEKISWGQGLYRYMTDLQVTNMLKDIIEIKKYDNDYNSVKEFYEYFYTIKKLDITDK